MASDKERLDILLVDLGYFPSRERAKRAIMAGIVFVDGLRVDKAGTKVETNSKITVKADPVPYVGRGGIKLEKAIKHFRVKVKGKRALDIGASTGGFTDCLLQNGAERVYAIDVGYGQLDWKLRQDARVVVMERTNIRYVKPEDIGETCDIAVIDVAFISLKLVLPVVKSLLRQDCEVIALIKPQFEAGRDKVGKKGIVRDPHVHLEVVENIADFLEELELRVAGLTYSPITGSDGNIEYLIYGVGKGFENQRENRQEIDINRIVEESHSALGQK